VSESARCARCDRAVQLKYKVPGGMICSRCREHLNAAPCVDCERKLPVACHDADGQPLCSRCHGRRRAPVIDEARRQAVLEAVARADPDFDARSAHRVLAESVTSRRSLRRLANRVNSEPDVFSIGPTSDLPVLDRFTKALVAAGAAVSVIHPTCASCGRHQPLRGHSAAGDICAACDARARRRPCTLCQKSRPVYCRDENGQPICEHCVAAARRRNRLGQMTEAISAIVRSGDSSVRAGTVADAVERVAPKMPRREVLLEQLIRGPKLTEVTTRHVLVARLLCELRAAGSELPAAACEDCNEPAEPLVTVGKKVRCRPCTRLCPRCGAPRKEPETRLCRVCDEARKPEARRSAPRTRGTCAKCDRPHRVLDAELRCRGCRERAERCCARCKGTGSRTWFEGAWVCLGCALIAEVDSALGPAELLSPPMAVLREAIVSVGNPLVARRWLANTNGGRLLRSLVASGVPLTHEALDEAGADHSVEHLRHLLVAAGVLPDEEREIERLEASANELIDRARIDLSDRKVIRSWLRWGLLARLRRRVGSGRSMAWSVTNAYPTVREVISLLEALHGEERSLARTTQPDIDNYFARTGANRWRARPFLVWARKRGHLSRNLSLPGYRRREGAIIGDHQERWTLARRLVTDDTIPADLRVAGALVVLYGQPLVRIARLAEGALHRSEEGTSVLELDRHLLPIHEPFATLAEQLPLRRTNGVSDRFSGRWLFPGRLASNHITPSILGHRLQKIGIEPRTMRNTARAQLASEIPPAVLHEIIGITAKNANDWAARSMGNWHDYAAEENTQ